MATGPDRGFEPWYRDLHPRLVASLTGAFGDVDAAEECAAEAIARAYARWDDVAAMASPAGWTYRVAFNVARRRLRRRSMELRLVQGFRVEVAAAPAGELWEIVAELPPRQRQAVVLRHVAHLTEPEIAEVMGITRGAVSSTLRSAYRSLRGELVDVHPSQELSP